MILIPTWLLLFWLFLLGSVIGSFLGVVSYRLHTGRSLNGHSHCESCTHGLAWYELVPVVSYLVLKGRCKECGSYIPSRHFLVEILTGSLFAIAGLFIFQPVELIMTLILISLLVVIIIYDIRHLIIPDELVLGVAALIILMFIYDNLHTSLTDSVVTAVLVALGTAGFYALLWFISRGRAMGFGDVKLAFPLGFMLSAKEAFSMIVFSFWIGAVISLLLMAWPHIKNISRSLVFRLRHGYSRERVENYAKYLTMKSEVPFAPFLIAAFLLVILAKIDVFTLSNYVLDWFTKI